MTASHHWLDPDHRDQMPARFTAAGFIELVQHPPIVDWPGKIELVAGEIVRMAPANVRHWNMQRIAFLRL